jgi:hypothetical protein
MRPGWPTATIAPPPLAKLQSRLLELGVRLRWVKVDWAWARVAAEKSAMKRRVWKRRRWRGRGRGRGREIFMGEGND